MKYLNRSCTMIFSAHFRVLRNTLFILCTLFPGYSQAETENVLMWQMPDSGIKFPVYVLKNAHQSVYLYSPSQQSILGEYDKNTTTATYDLYYESNNTQWHSCKLSLKSGGIDSKTTTCPGAVINKPLPKSNVYTITVASTAWPSTSIKPVPNLPFYSDRNITFKNNTAYDKIRIGQVCTKSKNPNNSKCKNSQKRWEIAKGDTQVFQFDTVYDKNLTGLISTAFTVTAYKQAGKWIETGGYGVAQTPYATKIELSALPIDENNVSFPVPQGNTNFDISVVDGYNISAKAYPIGGGYCTYTVPPENSNILGAGYYDKNNSLASISTSETLCDNSSQLPKNYSGKIPEWNLTKKTKTGMYEGCLSPCTYAKLDNNSSQDKFCCTGSSYGTPSKCDQAKGLIGANTSTYVTNLDSNYSTHVYRFAYDDAIGDFACPPDTSIAVIFE